MTITTNATKQIQNMKPLIAMNVQKKSPNDSNIYSSCGGRLHAQKNKPIKITNIHATKPERAKNKTKIFKKVSINLSLR
jgi:hypothetical protein